MKFVDRILQANLLAMVTLSSQRQMYALQETIEAV